ncbi:transcriptional regulator HosA [Oxobacter pfennigii]|uniref:Transcriptional regulator HosA n=1 Tax=Oxobacter pfennigii TaxID=36849 RepID=A0A0P9AGA4_9CLOT|nr:MarR family winged helix-turn-helix transcriptional regulator [Oxobacter pfennigii]KPU44439.1 transcriptional regulator HosA [Oxobacter pfennigii]
MDKNDFTNEAPNLVTEELFSLFLRCSHALSRGHHQNAKIHPSQQRVLSLLASKDKITQRDLLDIMQIRAASLSELLTKMEGKGLISRTRTDGTKRSVDVEITDLGEAVMAEYTCNQQETAKELFSGLTEDEQRQMVQLLSKLIEDWHNRHHGSEGSSGVPEHSGNGHHAHHHGSKHYNEPECHDNHGSSGHCRNGHGQ